MTELEASGVGEHPPPYMIFLVVFLFFITGLLGFLVCHLLKKKGYRCRTGDMDDDEEEEEKIGVNEDDEEEDNQDTVERILKCIIENEANMEAFNDMLGNYNICAQHDPRFRKESIAGIPPHHHTVHSGTDHNSCHLCAQIRSKKGRRQSRTPRSKQRPGEQTVFSVGRFRVTHTDKKLPHPLVTSGDQLDQSQESDERKEGGYNLRSMFKDVRPPSESSNGIAVNVGKRRKSLTIFGLRRGSDPVGIRGLEATGRETGGVKFAIQQQPVVLEEPTQSGRTVTAPEPGSKPETKQLNNQSPASPQSDAKLAGSVYSPSVQSTKQAQNSSSSPKGASKHSPSPEPSGNLTVKHSVGSMATSVPSSLLIPTSTGQTSSTVEKQGRVDDKVLPTEEDYDPGPLQTSTPIVPFPGSILGFTSNQPESSSSKVFQVTQSPDVSSSSDLEADFGASPALISLGSSPPSSFPIKTPLSASSLKTPTSPQVITPSPKLSSKNMSSFSPAVTPSPEPPRAMLSQSLPPSKTLQPSQGRTPSPGLSKIPKPDIMPESSQTLSSPGDQNPPFKGSPNLTVKLGSVSGTSTAGGDAALMPGSLREQETDEQKEVKRSGILKTPKLSPAERGFNVSDQLSKDSLSNLPLSPSNLLSSSLGRSKVSSTTIVKASPESRREFSVVTVAEESKSSTSTRDQKGETYELRVESEKVEESPTVTQRGDVSVSGTGRPERQGETPAAEVRPALSQDRDDIMEMEDIRDCKVMQVQEVQEEEEKEKMVHSQLKQD